MANYSELFQRGSYPHHCCDQGKREQQPPTVLAVGSGTVHPAVLGLPKLTPVSRWLTGFRRNRDHRAFPGEHEK